MAAVARLAASFGMLSLWLALLLMGWTAGGAVYLLLAGAVALFPWGELRGADPPGGGEPAAGPAHDGRSDPG